MDFVQTCNENGIKPIAGIEFRREDELLYIGLARNNEGFRELNEFLTHHTINEISHCLISRRGLENVVLILPIQPIGDPLVKWRNGESENVLRWDPPV